MGKDFFYYLEQKNDDDTDRQEYYLKFSVSRCNDVLKYILYSDRSWNTQDIQCVLDEIRNRLKEGDYEQQYDGTSDAKECIKIFREILGIMEDEALDTIWLRYW